MIRDKEWIPSTCISQALIKDENFEGTEEGIITGNKSWEATVKLSWTSSLNNSSKVSAKESTR